jgi:hypothetical protein
MRLHLKSLYSDHYFKTYWDLYYSETAFDKIKSNLTEQEKEQYTTYPYLINKKEIIITNPMKASINEDLFFKQLDIALPITKSIIYGMNKILPIYHDGGLN